MRSFPALSVDPVTQGGVPPVPGVKPAAGPAGNADPVPLCAGVAPAVFALAPWRSPTDAFPPGYHLAAPRALRPPLHGHRGREGWRRDAGPVPLPPPRSPAGFPGARFVFRAVGRPSSRQRPSCPGARIAIRNYFTHYFSIVFVAYIHNPLRLPQKALAPC